jgi:carbon monoxide dehydrogenase subunit G
MTAKSLAAAVAGILLVPVLLVLVVTAVGPVDRFRWFAAATIVLGIAGFIVIFTAKDPPREQPDYERSHERYMASVAIAFALAVATMAALVGDGDERLTVAISSVSILWALIWLPTATRRIGIRTSVVVARDPSTVFNFLADMRNWPLYASGADRVEKITDGPIGRGTRFRTKTAEFEGIEEITDFEPPALMTSSLVSGLRPNQTVLALEPLPEGTKVSHGFHSEISYPSALLGAGLLRSVLTSRMRSARNATWQRLKQVLESGAC